LGFSSDARVLVARIFAKAEELGRYLDFMPPTLH
jgi:hypothetical protein